MTDRALAQILAAHQHDVARLRPDGYNARLCLCGEPFSPQHQADVLADAESRVADLEAGITRLCDEAIGRLHPMDPRIPGVAIADLRALVDDDD